MRRVLLLLALNAGVVGPVAASVSMGLAGHSEMLWPVSWLAWAPVGYVILLRRPGNGGPDHDADTAGNRPLIWFTLSLLPLTVIAAIEVSAAVSVRGEGNR